MWKYMGCDLDPQSLPPMASLIASLSEDGADDRAMSKIRAEQWERYGMDLVWRYPISEEDAVGAFIVPVQEGILWIPYEAIDKEDGELLELKDAHLLSPEECEYLLADLRSYTDGLCSMLAEATQICSLTTASGNSAAQDSAVVSAQKSVHLSIYAVIEDWAVDDEPGHNEELFTSHNDALVVYQKKLAEEQANGSIPLWSGKDNFTTDETDEFYEAWLDGEYVSNHYKLTIEQKLMQFDPDFVHKLDDGLKQRKEASCAK